MKKLKITTDRKPWAAGSPAMMGDTVEVSDEEATVLLQAGFAEEVSGSAKKAPKRARNSKGQLQSDDPSTPDVNEAWEGGVAPKKRGRPKKK